MVSQIVDVFKLRIGFMIAVTALVGYAVTPGRELAIHEIALLAIGVLLSSASAGAFNQYAERDLDAKMARTQQRAFVTGRFHHGPLWLVLIASLLLMSLVIVSAAFNAFSALYVFLGAVFYGIVYTLWLKRRSAVNIVVGGLAGSFAVLAGSAAADPQLNAVAIWLAVVLFLWTPPHFWSLAISLHEDYAAAKVPMLPVVVGDAEAARIIAINTSLLVGASIMPFFYGMGWIYLTAALCGGGYFLFRSWQLIKNPNGQYAMKNFFASLIQLSLLLAGATLDSWLLGSPT